MKLRWRVNESLWSAGMKQTDPVLKQNDDLRFHQSLKIRNTIRELFYSDVHPDPFTSDSIVPSNTWNRHEHVTEFYPPFTRGISTYWFQNEPGIVDKLNKLCDVYSGFKPDAYYRIKTIYVYDDVYTYEWVPSTWRLVK